MQDKITFRNKVSLISFLLSLGVVYQHAMDNMGDNSIISFLDYWKLVSHFSL